MSTTTETSILDAVTQPDTSRIAFAVEVRPVRYGDDKTFHEYRIIMRIKGEVVGVEDGPSRKYETSADALRLGNRRVEQLIDHKLFAVPITAKDIDDGEARSCRSCAIAQALWRNQERIGLSKHGFDFRVEPYGMFVDVRGIVLKRHFDSHSPELATGEDGMPDIAFEFRGKVHTDSMYEWASNFDEYADSVGIPLDEWRESMGFHDDETPSRPMTGSFVLNLTEMKLDNA